MGRASSSDHARTLGGVQHLWRRLPHLIVTGIFTFLAAIGWFGGGTIEQRFDAKTIILERTSETALTVSEVVDIDFGTFERRGYERTLRTDFGFPEDVVAASETMPDRVTVDRIGREARIRIGDPDITGTGRHRYALVYTLPFAFDGDTLNYSVIDPGEEFETGRFTIVLDGFRLEDSVCSVGSYGSVGGCEFVEVDGRQTVTFEPLAAGDGINISGTAVYTPLGEFPEIPPPFEPRDEPSTVLIALAIALVGLVLGELVVRLMIRRGSNEVGTGGASGAAFWQPGSPTQRLSDDALAALATIEFAPPDDVSPWEGRVLLRESVPDDSPAHWFTSMLGRGAITLTETEDGVTLAPGDGIEDVDPADRALLTSVFPGGRPRTVTKSYDPGFAFVWKEIHTAQRDRIEARRWWTGKVSGVAARSFRVGAAVLAVFIGFGVFVAVAATEDAGTANPFGSLGVALIVTAVAAALLAFFVTLPERFSRTAAGSSAYLRTESFRRFLAESEARHVEQAYERGVLREYTGWAVALGEAEAWKKAAATIGSAAVAAAVTSSMYFYYHGHLFRDATTKPSSSSSSGGSSSFGGGGGGVGGGGGGGSSGSW